MVMTLPPTSDNLLQHILRAHLQCIIWKVVDCDGPPDESINIKNFGWEFRDGIPILVIAKGDPAPSELLDMPVSVSVPITGQEVFNGGMWMPKASPAMHVILQLSWWAVLF